MLLRTEEFSCPGNATKKGSKPPLNVPITAAFEEENCCMLRSAFILTVLVLSSVLRGVD